jgi:hypothetical protein
MTAGKTAKEALADIVAGSALRKGDAGSIDLQQYQPQHQCPKGTPIAITAY